MPRSRSYVADDLDAAVMSWTIGSEEDGMHYRVPFAHAMRDQQVLGRRPGVSGPGGHPKAEPGPLMPGQRRREAPP